MSAPGITGCPEAEADCADTGFFREAGAFVRRGDAVLALTSGFLATILALTAFFFGLPFGIATFFVTFFFDATEVFFFTRTDEATFFLAGVFFLEDDAG